MRLKIKVVLLAILSLSNLLLAGCETVKGAGQGLVKDWHTVAGANGFIQRADNWIKKNLW